LTGQIDGQPGMLGISSRQAIEAWTRLKLRPASGG
jgi:hypothetical protein